jgi:hypothetical protein
MGAHSAGEGAEEGGEEEGRETAYSSDSGGEGSRGMGQHGHEQAGNSLWPSAAKRGGFRTFAQPSQSPDGEQGGQDLLPQPPPRLCPNNKMVGGP